MNYLNWTNSLVRQIVEKPKRFVLASIVLFIISAMGNPYYQNTLDYHFFFSPDNPQLAAFDKLQEDYSKTEAVFVAIAPEDGDVFKPENLAIIEQFTKQAWSTPHSMRVDSLTNFQYTIGSEEGLDITDLFENSETMTPEILAKRKEFALSEPSLVNALVSDDGRVAGVRLTINMPGINHEKETPEVVFHVRKLAADIEKQHPGIHFYLTGQIVVDQSFPEATEADFNFVWPAFLVVMMLLLALIYRGVLFMVITIVTGLLAIGAGLGLVGWTELKVNAAITAAPVMILTLAIADCIHILSSYTHELRLGKSKQVAMTTSLRINFTPILLTTFMTALGFLTLHFNDSPPYQALGYAVASGVFYAMVFAIIFLPALMMLIPHKIPKEEKNNDPRSEMMVKLAGWVVGNNRWLPWLMGGISLFFVLSLSLNEINDNPVKYFGEKQTMRQHLDFVNNNITGIGALNYSLDSGEEGGVSNPEYLRKVDQFSQWLKTQPGVVQVDTFVDVIKRVNKSLHADDESYYRVPDSRNEIAQYILLYELSLPIGMDINNIVTSQKSASRVRVAMTNTEGRYHIELNKKAIAWLKNNTPENMWSEGASAPLMFAHIGKRSIDGMLGGLIGALFIMSGLMVFILKSPKLAAISLVSNVIPVAMAFGLWGWVNGTVDLGITVTLGIAFGIVVDDTIHFLSKYQRARRELGYGTEEAITYAFSTVGVALLITTVVLIAGFSMLGFSDMNITANMAILTTVTIAFAFIVDFFLVPGLLLKFDKDKGETGL
jgi:predicted RND superfamily exporter protein